MISITNELITVGIKKVGAELASLKRIDSQLEYIWKADPSYWGRHSCLLFPVIGSVNADVIRVDGEVYPMKKHGIVRDLPFTLENKEEDRAVFTIESDNELKKMFPFDWKLDVIYELVQNRCRIIYKVENRSQGLMPLSIGAHPGITCPLDPNKKRSDYHLLFDSIETQDSPLLNDNGLVKSDTKRIMEASSRIDIIDELFDEDALILSDYQSSTVSLVDDEGHTHVRVGIDGFTHLGIWSQNRRSPYICIEPWIGHADPEGYKGEFKDKPGNALLTVGETLTCEHWIEIFDK